MSGPKENKDQVFGNDKLLVANDMEFKFIQCKIRALMFRLGEKLIFQREDRRLLPWIVEKSKFQGLIEFIRCAIICSNAII